MSDFEKLVRISLQSKSTNPSVYNDILKNIGSIAVDGVLLNNSKSETAHFIDKFLPKSIPIIFNIKTHNMDVLKNFQSILSSLVSLFSSIFLTCSDSFFHVVEVIITNSKIPFYLNSTEDSEESVSTLFLQNQATFVSSFVIVKIKVFIDGGGSFKIEQLINLINLMRKLREPFGEQEFAKFIEIVENLYVQYRDDPKYDMLLDSASLISNTARKEKIEKLVKKLRSAERPKALKDLRHLIENDFLEEQEMAQIIDLRFIKELQQTVTLDEIYDFIFCFHKYLCRTNDYEQFNNFLTTTIEQEFMSSAEDVNAYYKCFEFLVSNLDESFINVFIENVSKMTLFTNRLLKLIHIIPERATDQQKMSIFRQMYKIGTQKATLTPEFAETICLFIPKEKNMRLIILEKSLNSLVLPISYNIISECIPDLPETTYQDIASTMLSVLKKDISKRQIELLSFLAPKVELDESKLLTFIEQISPMIENINDSIIHLFTSLYMNDNLSFAFKEEIFKIVLGLNDVNIEFLSFCVSKYPNLLKILFDELTDKEDKKMDKIIVNLYSTRKIEFVKAVFNNIERKGVIRVLKKFIIATENSLDPDLYDIERSEFILEDQKQKVRCIGDINKEFFVSKTFGYSGITKMIANSVGLNLSACSFRVSKTNNEILINSKINDRNDIFEEEIYAVSQHLDENQMDILLKKVSDENDKEALQCLLLMPPIKSQIEAAKRRNSFDLSMLSFYHLSLIGNIFINLNNSIPQDCINGIFKLAMQLKCPSIVYQILGIAVISGIEIEVSEEEIMNLVEIAFSKTDNLIIADILHLFGLLLQQHNITIKPNHPILKKFLSLSKKILTETNFGECLIPSFGCFDTNEMISFLLSLSNECLSNYSRPYLELIDIVSVGCTEIWNCLVSNTMKILDSPDNASLEAITHKGPPKEFTSKLLESLTTCLMSLDSVKNIDEISNFIITKVFLNRTTYYEPSVELFRFLSALDDKNYGLILQFSAILEAHFDAYRKMKPEYHRIDSDCTNRTLDSQTLVSALIIQISNLIEIRNGILSAHYFEDSWRFKLQMLIAKLIYFPSNVIHMTEINCSFEDILRLSYIRERFEGVEIVSGKPQKFLMIDSSKSHCIRKLPDYLLVKTNTIEKELNMDNLVEIRKDLIKYSIVGSINEDFSSTIFGKETLTYGLAYVEKGKSKKTSLYIIYKREDYIPEDDDNISEETTMNLIEDISKSIIMTVIKDPRFKEFYYRVKLEKESGSFNFGLFINSFQSSNTKRTRNLADRCCYFCQQDSSFSDYVIQQPEHLRYLLYSKIMYVRKSYAEVLIEALSNCKCETDEFLRNLMSVVEDSKIIERWKSFHELFEVIGAYFETFPEKITNNHMGILCNVIVMHLSKFMKRNNSQIYAMINCSPIFDAIKVAAKQFPGHAITVVHPENVPLFINNSRHCKAYLSLLSTVLSDNREDQDLFMTVIKTESMISPAELANYFVCSLSINDSLFYRRNDLFFSVLKEKTSNYVRDFLIALSNLAKHCTSAIEDLFLESTPIWIDHFILVITKSIRTAAISVFKTVLKDYPEKPTILPPEMYQKLKNVYTHFKNKLSDLIKIDIKISNDTDLLFSEQPYNDNFPDFEYLKFLLWLIRIGNLQDDFLIDGKFVTNYCTKFSKIGQRTNISLTNWFMFLFKVWTPYKTPLLLETACYSTMLSTLKTLTFQGALIPSNSKILLEFFERTEDDHLKEFMKSESARNMIEFGLQPVSNTGAEIRIAIFKKLDLIDTRVLSSILFDINLFKVAMENNSWEAFHLMWSILKKYPANSVLFYEHQLYKLVWSNVRPFLQNHPAYVSTSLPENTRMSMLKVVSSFFVSLPITLSEPTGFLRKSPLVNVQEWLKKETVDVPSIFEKAISIETVDTRYPSAYFDILIALSSISSVYAQKVISTLEQLQNNGEEPLVSKAPKPLLRNVTKFVGKLASVCLAQNQIRRDRALKIVTSEFVYCIEHQIDSIAVIGPMCYHISGLIVKGQDEDLVERIENCVDILVNRTRSLIDLGTAVIFIASSLAAVGRLSCCRPWRNKVERMIAAEMNYAIRCDTALKLDVSVFKIFNGFSFIQSFSSSTRGSSLMDSESEISEQNREISEDLVLSLKEYVSINGSKASKEYVDIIIGEMFPSLKN